MKKMIILFHRLLLGFIASVMLFAVGCSLEDDRDLCCGINTMSYTYHNAGAEYFDRVIEKMEYHLFDSVGLYLHRLRPCCGKWDRLSLEGLSPGRYTIVALANLEGYGSLYGHVSSGLDLFRLEVDSMFDSKGSFCSGDSLYWGERSFCIEEGVKRNFTTEMNNIHCRLRVKVEWERLPQYPDGYRFCLEGIGCGVGLHKDGNTHATGGHIFPCVSDYSGKMMKDVSLYRLGLDEEMYTLRYTNEHIPVFWLYNGDTPIVGPIDLKRAFREWGWNPDSDVEQDYTLRMKIRVDGSIIVNPGLEGTVSDWIDGGYIGF